MQWKQNGVTWVGGAKRNRPNSPVGKRVPAEHRALRENIFLHAPNLLLVQKNFDLSLTPQDGVLPRSLSTATRRLRVQRNEEQRTSLKSAVGSKSYAETVSLVSLVVEIRCIPAKHCHVSTARTSQDRCTSDEPGLTSPLSEVSI